MCSNVANYWPCYHFISHSQFSCSPRYSSYNTTTLLYIFDTFVQTRPHAHLFTANLAATLIGRCSSIELSCIASLYSRSHVIAIFLCLFFIFRYFNLAATQWPLQLSWTVAGRGRARARTGAAIRSSMERRRRGARSTDSSRTRLAYPHIRWSVSRILKSLADMFLLLYLPACLRERSEFHVEHISDRYNSSLIRHLEK